MGMTWEKRLAARGGKGEPDRQAGVPIRTGEERIGMHELYVNLVR